MKRVTILVAVLVVTAAATAAADEKAEAEARKQFKQGVQLYEQEKYEAASIAFARAYELKPSYRLLYNIGQVESELEHYAAAFRAYTRYLAEGGKEVDAARRAEVEAELERLTTLVGFIRIAAPVDGAKVKVDNEVVGTTPLAEPLLVDIGKHEVAVQRAGEELLFEVVKVAGGQTVELTVEQRTEPPPAQEAPAAAQPAPPPLPEEKAPVRVWTWVAGGVGVAAGVAAAITGGLASAKAKDLESGCDGSACPPERWDDLDAARRLATATDVLIAVAATGVAAGVALFFLEPRLGERPGAVVAPAATADGVSITMVGRF